MRILYDFSMYRRAAVMLALVIVLAVVASSGALHNALLSALSVTDEIIERHLFLGAVVFVALAAASAMLAFVSIAVVVPIAVSAWGASVTVALLWLGWILGGIATYNIGRFLGRPIVQWFAAEARTSPFRTS